MGVTQEIHERAVSLLKDGIEKANKYYGLNLSVPNVRYDLRGTVAGKALCREWAIKLNGGLAHQEGFIEQTVPHELAHLIDYKVNPENLAPKGYTWTVGGRVRRPKRDVHGADFKFILGTVLECDNTSRCHNFDVSETKIEKTKYTYMCTCGCGKTYDMSGKAHNKARMGTNYWLKGREHNKAPLKFIGVKRPGQDAPQPLKDVSKLKPIMPHVAQNPIPPLHFAPTDSLTNKDVARRIYNSVATRGEFISQCEKFGIRKTTASTYYQNFKSGLWK